MINNGRVLFYNESDGKGIIITSDKSKLDFTVSEWNDFETMPSLGLDVFFDIVNNIPVNITTLMDDNENDITEEITSEEVYDEDVVEEILHRTEEYLTEELDQDVDSEENNSETESSDQAVSVKDQAKKYLDQHNERIQEAEAKKEEAKNLKRVEEELLKKALLDKEIENKKIEKSALEEERSSITITLNISTAVENYFNNIKGHIDRRSAYKKVDGKLDYVLIKRFLSTTFNNLVDIDLHIITPRIKALNADLKEMGGVYEDFTNKTRHPHLAFKEVFLTCQSEYMKVKNGAQYTIEKLKQLQVNESSMEGMLKVKKEELNKNINTVEFTALQNEFKSLNGAYVDVVHMMAELDERYKNDMRLLQKFEDEYREDFYEVFGVEALEYKKRVLEVLNSQAYIFDAHMWNEAKKSKAVKAHFIKSNITGNMNTKTYLKYYLDTLNSEKTSEAQKNLFKLYEQMEMDNPDYILIVMSSPQDAMEHESVLKQSCKSIKTKSFIDEKSALKWAVKNSIKILILEDRLQTTTADRFLYVYQKNIFHKPNVIIFGEKPKSSPYSIYKLFSKNASPKVLIDSVKELLK